MQLASDGVKIAYTAYQIQEPPFWANLYGKTVTTSILFADGELYSGTHQLTHNDWFTTFVNHGNVERIQLGIDNTDFTNNNVNFIRIRPITYGTLSSAIAAVKLELGDHQTLAHQENGVWVLNEIPNYQQELAKCQRYQFAFNFAAIYSTVGTGFVKSGVFDICVPIPVTLRGFPTIIGSISVTNGSYGKAISSFSVTNMGAGCINFHG